MDQQEIYKKIELTEEYYLGIIESNLKGPGLKLIESLHSLNLFWNEWYEEWIHGGKGFGSKFDMGAERCIYKYLNSDNLGKPISSPIGSDLLFIHKTENFYPVLINIDLKTVSVNNIGDIKTNLFVGENQNSYKSDFYIGPENLPNEKKEIRTYKPNLRTKYNIKNKEYLTLSYLISILYEEKNDSIEVVDINILSIPNGDLVDVYQSDPIDAGKKTVITPGQVIKIENGEYTTKKGDTWNNRKKKSDGTIPLGILATTNTTKERIIELNGQRPLNYDVVSARFNFSKCKVFRLLNNKKRFKNIYFKEDVDSDIKNVISFFRD